MITENEKKAEPIPLPLPENQEVPKPGTVLPEQSRKNKKPKKSPQRKPIEPEMSFQEKMKQAVEIAKAQGLEAIEFEGIKIHIPTTHHKKQSEQQEQSEAELLKELTKTPFDDLTEDEVLFYATPYFDELQEEKKKKQESIQTEREVRGEDHGS